LYWKITCLRIIESNQKLKTEFSQTKEDITNLIEKFLPDLNSQNDDTDLKEIVAKSAGLLAEPYKSTMFSLYDPIKQKIKNSILINCLDDDPLNVLLQVAREEGKHELPGYYRNR